jgi:hypothetical protein
MKQKCLWLGIALAVAIVAMSGCTHRMYSGPELPPEEIAIVKSGVGLACLVIASIDDEKLRSYVGGPDKVELLPGYHKIGIKACERVRRGNIQYLKYDSNTLYINLRTEAGHVYVMKCKEKGFFKVRFEVWFEDVTSEQ